MLSLWLSLWYLSPVDFFKNFLLIILFTFSGSPLALAEPTSEFRLGLMTELSGPWVSGSGALCKRGYDLARQTLAADGTYKGKKIRFFYGDTQGRGESSISELNRLVSGHKVQAIVTNRSQVGMALNPISKRRKLPLIGIVGHNSFISDNPYSFRTWPSTKLEGEALSRIARKQGFKRIAVIALEDEWTISFRDQFVNHFTANGGTIVLSESFISSDSDFSSIVSKLRSIDIDSVLVDLGPTQTGPFLARLREQDFRTQIFSNFYIRNPETIAVAGAEALEGAILTEVDVEKKVLRDGLLRIFDDDTPNQYKYTCYAGVKWALDAIANADTNSSEAIAQSMKSMRSLDLFGEQIPIENRELVTPLVVKQFRNGKLETLGPMSTFNLEPVENNAR